jgi:hypothetical protein
LVIISDRNKKNDLQQDAEIAHINSNYEKYRNRSGEEEAYRLTV